jgi:hypothetical protein
MWHKSHSRFLLPFFIFGVMLLSLIVGAGYSSERAGAVTNSNLNFQGRLLTNTGALVPDGSYNVEFRLYDDPVAGTNFWTETRTGGNAMTVRNGYFSVYLGDVTPFGGTIPWDQELWLGMNVNSDGEMTPRFKLSAVPYAFRAGAITDAAGNAYTGDDLAQLAPANVQAVNAAVAALRLNQAGSGALLQLQGDGVDRFLVDKSGGVITGAGIQIGNSSATNAGNIRWTGTDFEGYDGTQWVSLTSGSGPSGNFFEDGGNSFGGLAVIGTNDTFGLAFETDGVERMRIDTSGNVGIGQTSPQERLDVDGGVRIGNSTGTNAGTIRWTGTDFEGYNGVQWVSLTSTGSTTVIGSQTATFISGVLNLPTNSTGTLAGMLVNTTATAFSIATGTGSPTFVAPADGSFRSCTVVSNANRTAGTATLRWRVNGVSVGAGACVIDATNVRTSASVLDPGVVTFNAGDTIGVAFDSSGLSPNTTERLVYWAVDYEGGAPSGGLGFVQNGNDFGETAVLGTTDGFGLNIITNNTTALSVSAAGLVSFVNNATFNDGLTVSGSATFADGLTVSSSGIDVTGNSTLSGTLSGLTGLSLTSGNIDLNSGGIVNAGSITGVGPNITALNNLTISSGGASDLALSSASGLLLIDADTWRRSATGTTTLQLNDSSDTTFSILNNSGSAVANLLVEGDVTAATFNGDGSGLTSLNADNISSGTISDGLLSSNVALLNVTQSFSGLNTFSSGLVLGNTGSTTAGALRFNGVDFEGYDGTQWVSLTAGISPGGGDPVTATFYDAAGGDTISTTFSTINLDTTLTNSDNTLISLSADEVTVTEDGFYEISYQLTARLASGTRSGFNAKLQLDAGSGFNDVAGSQAYHYGRITSETQGTSAATVVLELSAGDVLRLQGRGTSQSFTTIADATSLSITRVTSSTGGGGPSNAYVQGGNSFGATAILGTSDSNGLEIITNGVPRLLITNTGEATFSGNLNVDGLSTFDAAVSFNGGVTLGDNAGDALNIVSSSVSASNGLNFNTGLFVIDALNNRIGINNSSPDGGSLRVNTATTLDSTAEVMFSTSSLSNKGLVLQGVSGQVANLFETQNSNGEALLVIGANGELGLGLSNVSNGLIRFSNDTNANIINLSGGLATANRTINLPDADGSLCLAESVDCGYVLFAQTTAQVDSSTNDSIQINKTGASGNILRLERSGNGVFTIANNGAVSVQVAASDAFRVADDLNNQLFAVDTSNGLVRIGGNTPDGTGIILVLDNKNTAGDPVGEDGAIYYNSSLGRFRCYEDGSWKDCIGTRQVRSFIDTTSDAVFDNNTTNYWDTSAENNFSFPNITPATTTRAITGSVTFETQSATTADRSVVTRVERSIGAPVTCNSGTPVGTILSTFTTNNGEQASNTMIFLDEPNTTSIVYYTLCADTATSSGASMTINRIRFTLEEANNSN